MRASDDAESSLEGSQAGRDGAGDQAACAATAGPSSEAAKAAKGAKGSKAKAGIGVGGNGKAAAVGTAAGGKAGASGAGGEKSPKNPKLKPKAAQVRMTQQWRAQEQRGHRGLAIKPHTAMQPGGPTPYNVWPPSQAGAHTVAWGTPVMGMPVNGGMHYAPSQQVVGAPVQQHQMMPTMGQPMYAPQQQQQPSQQMQPMQQHEHLAPAGPPMPHSTSAPQLGYHQLPQVPPHSMLKPLAEQPGQVQQMQHVLSHPQMAPVSQMTYSSSLPQLPNCADPAERNNLSSTPGPLGLKLKKSHSLLNLVSEGLGIPGSGETNPDDAADYCLEDFDLDAVVDALEIGVKGEDDVTLPANAAPLGSSP